VTVFEANAVPGGRVATRHDGGFAFDHGAQYFTARDPGFARRVDDWRRAGLVARWEARIAVFEDAGAPRPGGEHPRFVARPAMDTLPRYLARDLDVRHGTEIVQIRKAGRGWRLEAADGTASGPFRAVLVTVPPADAAPLLCSVPDIAQTMAGITMQPCWW
jgi:predicted NAD/FAD-dependent oxidoreductase